MSTVQAACTPPDFRILQLQMCVVGQSHLPACISDPQPLANLTRVL